MEQPILDGKDGLSEIELQKLEQLKNDEKLFSSIKNKPTYFRLLDSLNEEIILTFQNITLSDEYKQKAFELYKSIHIKANTPLEFRLELNDILDIKIYQNIEKECRINKNKNGYQINFKQFKLDKLYFEDATVAEYIGYLIANMLYKYKKSNSDNPGNEFTGLPKDKKFTHFDSDKFGILLNFVGTTTDKNNIKTTDGFIVSLKDYKQNSLNLNNINTSIKVNNGNNNQVENEGTKEKLEYIIDFVHTIIEKGKF